MSVLSVISTQIKTLQNALIHNLKKIQVFVENPEINHNEFKSKIRCENWSKLTYFKSEIVKAILVIRHFGYFKKIYDLTTG